MLSLVLRHMTRQGISTATMQPAPDCRPDRAAAGLDQRHEKLHVGTRSVERMSAVLTVVTLSGVVSLAVKWRMARTQFRTTLLGHVCTQHGLCLSTKGFTKV